MLNDTGTVLCSGGGDHCYRACFSDRTVLSPCVESGRPLTPPQRAREALRRLNWNWGSPGWAPLFWFEMQKGQWNACMSSFVHSRIKTSALPCKRKRHKFSNCLGERRSVFTHQNMLTDGHAWLWLQRLCTTLHWQAFCLCLRGDISL